MNTMYSLPYIICKQILMNCINLEYMVPTFSNLLLAITVHSLSLSWFVLSQEQSIISCKNKLVLFLLHGITYSTPCVREYSLDTSAHTHSNPWKTPRSDVLQGRCDRFHFHSAGTDRFVTANCGMLTCLTMLQLAPQIAHSPPPPCFNSSYLDMTKFQELCGPPWYLTQASIGIYYVIYMIYTELMVIVPVTAYHCLYHAHAELPASVIHQYLICTA
jgi:hypothetical protein